jgi:hypothetical protein
VFDPVENDALTARKRRLPAEQFIGTAAKMRDPQYIFSLNQMQ